MSDQQGVRLVGLEGRAIDETGLFYHNNFDSANLIHLSRSHYISVSV
jgi:hypothetical protein